MNTVLWGTEKAGSKLVLEPSSGELWEMQMMYSLVFVSHANITPHVLRVELPLPPQNKTIEQILLRAVNTFSYCLLSKIPGKLVDYLPKEIKEKKL